MCTGTPCSRTRTCLRGCRTRSPGTAPPIHRSSCGDTSPRMLRSGSSWQPRAPPPASHRCQLHLHLYRCCTAMSSPSQRRCRGARRGRLRRGAQRRPLAVQGFAWAWRNRGESVAFLPVVFVHSLLRTRGLGSSASFSSTVLSFFFCPFAFRFVFLFDVCDHPQVVLLPLVCPGRRS